MIWPGDFINQVICGDCIEVMKDIPDNSIDSIVTDPPYGLSFMGKKWDYQVPSIDLWKECLRVLKPGGTALIFAGSRTQHRMACNIEDAGFILKDCIMWLYGSGFPKATDISKQIDKDACRKQLEDKLNRKSTKEEMDEAWEAFRKVVGTKDGANLLKSNAFTDKAIHGHNPNVPITAPSTPQAQAWNGWKSHGLKPSYEPILICIKPNQGSYANNAMKWGVGGLWIDGGRVGSETLTYKPRLTHNANLNDDSWSKIGQTSNDVTNQGRYPANIILDEEAGRMLDEQSGESVSSGGKGIKTQCPNYDNHTVGHHLKGMRANLGGLRDSGGASRFFYCAKASKGERNAGCEGMEKKRQTVRWKGAEGDDWKNIEMTSKNNHPTVKPLKLMEYLCKLTRTPAGGIVLDPFMGSGTTGIACVNTGRKFIGIEKDKEYCKIAETRIEFFRSGKLKVKEDSDKSDPDQMDLF